MLSSQREELFRARIETHDGEGFGWVLAGLGERPRVMRTCAAPAHPPLSPEEIAAGHHVLDVFHTGPAWADTVVAGEGFTGPNHPNPTPWNHEIMTDTPTLTSTPYAARFVADMDHAHEAYHDGYGVGLHGKSHAKYVCLSTSSLDPARWATESHRAEVAADWIGGGYWDREGIDKDGDARSALREIVAVLLRFYEEGSAQGDHARRIRNNQYNTLREGAV